jgi:hypothetical protein
MFGGKIENTWTRFAEPVRHLELRSGMFSCMSGMSAIRCPSFILISLWALVSLRAINPA